MINFPRCCLRYNPNTYIARSAELNEALEQLRDGYFCPEEPGRFKEIYFNLTGDDYYLLCADYARYIDAHERLEQDYRVITPSPHDDVSFFLAFLTALMNSIAGPQEVGPHVSHEHCLQRQVLIWPYNQGVCKWDLGRSMYSTGAASTCLQSNDWWNWNFPSILPTLNWQSIQHCQVRQCEDFKGTLFIRIMLKTDFLVSAMPTTEYRIEYCPPGN